MMNLSYTVRSSALVLGMLLVASHRMTAQDDAAFLAEIRYENVSACAPPSNMGGNRIDDPAGFHESSAAVLSGIRIAHGRLVDSVTPLFRDMDVDGKLGGIRKGNHHGGSGGDAVVDVEVGQWVVTGLEVRVGDRVDAIRVTFHGWDPSVGRTERKFVSEWYGGGGGNCVVSLQLPRDRVAIGIIGRSGAVIDAIGLISAIYQPPQ